MANLLSKYLQALDLNWGEKRIVKRRAEERLNAMTDAEADRWLKDAAAELKKYGY
jgi:hypothetical protein